MKYLVFLSTLLLAASAQARIGETLQQCIARYGQVQTAVPETGVQIFSKNGFLIAVMFLDQRASMVMVSKTHRNSINIPDPLSENEIDLILKANGQGTPWIEQGAIIKTGEWLNEESELYASYDRIKNLLTIVTQEWIRLQQAKQDATEAKALNGF